MFCVRYGGREGDTPNTKGRRPRTKKKMGVTHQKLITLSLRLKVYTSTSISHFQNDLDDET